MKVIYIRTSTEEQKPELQINDCKSLSGEDYLLIKDQQSAWQDFKEREGFNQLKDLIKKKKVSELYVWDLDRIYRNRKKLIEFIEFCKIYNCIIHSYRQQWLEEINTMPSPWNEIIYKLMLEIMGWLAEEESTKKSDRIKNAIVKKDGKPTKSYKGNIWGRKSLSPQTISRVLEHRSNGLSISEICKNVWIYDKHGNKKKNISRGAVHKILTQKTLE